MGGRKKVEPFYSTTQERKFFRGMDTTLKF
jgi:hypothetical protein